MISKSINKLCKEDPSLIENYYIAVNDKNEMWDCHHRLETKLNVSGQYLKDNNLYYNRPASELIFLTHSEHSALHKNFSGKHHSEESKNKISDSLKNRNGSNNPMYGKHHSEESKNKQSKTMKGKYIGRRRIYREDGTYYYVNKNTI